MPLLNPTQIHKVLTDSNILPKRDGSKEQLPSLLADANLSAEEVLEHVSSMMRSGENDGVRLRAAEMGLKLNGLLQDNKNAGFIPITIVINDGGQLDVNPILIPR